MLWAHAYNYMHNALLSAFVSISLQATNIYYTCKSVGEHYGRLTASKLEILEEVQ